MTFAYSVGCNLLSGIGYFAFPSLKGFANLYWGFITTLPRVLAKPKSSLLSIITKIAFAGVIRSVIEIEHIEKHIAFIINTPYFSTIIAHKTYPNYCICIATQIFAGNNGIAFRIYVAIQIVLLCHEKSAICVGTICEKQCDRN